MNIKYLAIACAAVLIALGWMFRWEIVPIAAGGESVWGTAYMLDRWTGEAHYLYRETSVPVTPGKK